MCIYIYIYIYIIYIYIYIYPTFRDIQYIVISWGHAMSCIAHFLSPSAFRPL